jgi:LysR family glycine cleavage system transcriptional activator
VVASPNLMGKGPPISKPSDLAGHRLIHAQWNPLELRAPTWRTWVEIIGIQSPDGPAFGSERALYFQEELHAIEAVIAGQGVAICSDVLISRELKSGALVKLFDQPLPGLGFYLVHKSQHARLSLIKSFLIWIKSAFRDQSKPGMKTVAL